MIKRNIITNFVFTSDTLKLIVLEKLASTSVEVFYAQTKIEHHEHFIKESLSKIKTLVGGKIVNVSVILEPYKLVEEKIQIVRETIKVPSQIVQRQDIKNLIDLTKEKYESKTRKVILAQSITFETHDVITKTYNRAPIHKKGYALTITMALTTINNDIYNFIQKIMSHHNLNINQILLTCQALAFNHISDHAQNYGAALLSVDHYNSYLTIVRNYAVIGLLKLNNVGYSNLLHRISQTFGINSTEAHKILIVYGNLLQNIKPRIINLNHDLLANYNLHTNVKLNNIVKQFLENLLTATVTYLKNKLSHKYENFPIVISGQIVKIQGLEHYSRLRLQTELVSTYVPLTYVEKNQHNAYGLGLIKFMEKSDEVGAIFYDTIIETNPDTIPDFNFLSQKSLSEKSKGFFNKILHRIGGKYE